MTVLTLETIVALPDLVSWTIRSYGQRVESKHSLDHPMLDGSWHATANKVQGRFAALLLETKLRAVTLVFAIEQKAHTQKAYLTKAHVRCTASSCMPRNRADVTVFVKAAHSLAEGVSTVMCQAQLTPGHDCTHYRWPHA